MLILSRKRNERIEVQDIHGEIIATLVVVEVRGDKVRIGLEAGADIKIHRQEVAEAIRRNIAATTTSWPLNCSNEAPQEGIA